MEQLDFKSRPTVHELGVKYVQDLLDRVGFEIWDVNKDPTSPFQVFATIVDKVFLIAVRTDCHPNIGKIDNQTREKLITEAETLNAIPHFAGLSLTSLNGSDIEVEGLTEGKEYKIIFYGMTVVR